MRVPVPHLFAVAALLAVPGVADARAIEAETGRAKGDRAAVVKDRAARGGRAVGLEGRGSLRITFVARQATGLTVRARGASCRGAPKMRFALDGRRRLTRTVRSRRFSAYRIPLRAKAGRHVLQIGLANPRRSRSCRRRLAIDRLTVAEAPAIAAAPAPPTPVPQPEPEPPPPPPLVPTGYRNPVAANAPDPMVLRVGQERPEYYVFATGGGFPVRRSRDLVRWEQAHTAMETRPRWAVQRGDYHPWAPSVIERPGPCPDGQGQRCFVMFYVSLHAGLEPETNCIGVATSPDPAGPYTDHGPLEDTDRTRDKQDRPIGCGDDRGFSNIDPAPFVDSDGKAYLYLSTTNPCNPVTGGCSSVREIAVVDLASDLLTATGPRKPLFSAARDNWEEASFAPVVENPWVVKRGATYLLLYSGGHYQESYGMGYATASSPTGPFMKALENPFLKEMPPALSVGGGMLTTGPKGSDWLVYHGRENYGGPRSLRIDPVLFPTQASITAAGPTTLEQPAGP